tara:strand:- start:1110 stop:2900 length:1791 start_codon:yes stop_codon:yes gene_type:complete
MNAGPIAPLQIKKRLYSKLFLGFVLIGLLGLGLLKLKEMVYQPSFVPEYFPFGLEMEESVSIGDAADLESDDVKDLGEDKQAYKHALLLYKTGDSDGAWAILDTLIEKRPEHTHLLALLAQSALASKQMPEVLLDIRRKIHHYLKSNQHPSVSLQRALIDEQIENSQDARQVIHKIIKSSPQFSQAHFELARLEIMSDDYILARRSLQHSISLDPRTRETSYVMLGQLFHQQGYLDSLDQLLQYTLKVYPYNSDLNLYKGYLHEYRAELEEANRLYKRMQQLHPEDDRYIEAIETIGHKEPPISQSPNQNEPLLSIGIKALESLQANDPDNAGLAFAYYKLLILSATPDFLEKARAFHTENLNRFKNDPRWNLNKKTTTDETENPLDFVPKNNFDTSQVSNEVPESQISYDDTLLAKLQYDSDTTNKNHKRHWDLMGHYLIDWGSQISGLKSKYPETAFKRLKDNDKISVLQENYIQDKIRYDYTLIYRENTLAEILMLVQKDKGNNSDLLGEVLHRLVGVSGKPSKVRQEYCSGFKKFKAYHWSSQDNFEILIQFEGRSRQVRLLRVNPDLVPSPSTICTLLPKFLDWDDQKDSN